MSAKPKGYWDKVGGACASWTVAATLFVLYVMVGSPADDDTQIAMGIVLGIFIFPAIIVFVGRNDGDRT